MKRKDLYNYIREEIINELSEAPVPTTITDKSGVSKVLKVDNADAASITTIKTDPNITSATMGATKLKEMARVAKGLKPGKNIEDIKSIYTTSIAAKVLDLVEKAGENGITIKEIAEALGIKNVQQINPLIRELQAIGAISKDGASTEEPTSTVSEPEDIESKDEEEIEIEDTDDEEIDRDEEESTTDNWEKPEEEEEESKEFEKEPSAGDIKNTDIGVPTGKEAEINSIVSKIKTIANKIENLEGTEREAKIKALKQYINNNKSLLKGIDIDIITNGLIS